jgi:hypothetical protein
MLQVCLEVVSPQLELHKLELLLAVWIVLQHTCGDSIIALLLV